MWAKKEEKYKKEEMNLFPDSDLISSVLAIICIGCNFSSPYKTTVSLDGNEDYVFFSLFRLNCTSSKMKSRQFWGESVAYVYNTRNNQCTKSQFGWLNMGNSLFWRQSSILDLKQSSVFYLTNNFSTTWIQKFTTNRAQQTRHFKQ